MTVFDISKFFLEHADSLNGSQLQQLLYLAQCHHIGWYKKSLFSAKIHAGLFFPYVPVINEAVPYIMRNEAAGVKDVSIVTKDLIAGDSSRLTQEQHSTCCIIERGFMSCSPAELLAITKKDGPYCLTRDIASRSPANIRVIDSDPEITIETILKFYPDNNYEQHIAQANL